MNADSKLIGYNTDGIGAIAAMERHLKRINKSDRVVVFGAGGAARAMIFELLEKTGAITVLNRPCDINKARRLVSDFKTQRNELKFRPLGDREVIEEVAAADYVINATPVGMYPDVNSCILSNHQLKVVAKESDIGSKFFFDAVFNPYTTRFLSSGEKYGAKTCSGIYMMLYQGVISFKLWTNKTVPLSMVAEVRNRLEGKMHG